MKPFSITLVISAIVLIFIGLYALSNHRNRTSILFTILTLAAALYSFFYGLQMNSSHTEEAQIWYQLKYLAIPFIPTSLLNFVLSYSGYQKWFKGKWHLMLISVSLLFIVLIQTNSIHGFYYTNFSSTQQGYFLISHLDRGWLYWVYQGFQNICLLTGTLIIFHNILISKGFERKQALIIFVGCAIPWTTYIIYITGINKWGIDISAFAFPLSSVVFLYGITSFQALNFDQITLESVFENITDAVVVVNNQNSIKRINPAATSFTSLKPEEIKNRSFFDCFSGYPNLCDAFLKGQACEILLNISGQNRFFVFSANKLIDSRGIVGRIILLHDITNQKEAESIIRKNEEDLKELVATKDSLFSIIAHDLKGPMGSILGISELLAENHQKGNSILTNDLIGLLGVSSKQVFDLLNNLLEWYKAQSKGVTIEIQPVDPSRMINDAVALVKSMADQKGISINIKQVEKSILADPNMLTTILRNLLSNAIKFSHPNSSIELWMECVGNEVIFSVRDHGVGIDEAKSKVIFSDMGISSTLGTQKEKGTGLGLMLCKEFVEKHNGRIWVESESGKGSLFRFSIPLNSNCKA